MSSRRLPRCALAAALLALAAVAAAPQQAPKTVRVSSARELLRAVAPDTVIVLAPGDYDLARARDVRSRWVSWQGTEAGQDREVLISGVSGLTLAAEEGARVLAPPPYAWVLTFRGCRALRLERLAAGHGEPGYCVGGVLRLEGCRGVVVAGGELWGSGAVGVSVEDCTDVAVLEATVRDCTASAVWVRGSSGVVFDRVEMRGNEAWPLIEVIASSGVRFEGCTIDGNGGDTLFAMDGESEGVSLPGTVVTGNRVERFSAEDLPLPDISETTFSGNLFDEGGGDPPGGWGESGEDYFESEYLGDYPGDQPGDLGLDLPAGWTAVVDEGWPEVVFALESSGALEGLFIPLETEGGPEADGADPAGLRAAFRRALEELRRLVGERVGAQLRLQTGPVRVVSEGEYRQELSGSAFGAAADGAEAPEGGAGGAGLPARGLRGQLLQAGGSFYATLFLGPARALQERAEELEEVRAALELLVGD